jgi:hypothetical protein
MGCRFFSLLGFQILTDAAQLNEAQCGHRAKHGSRHHGHNSVHRSRAVALQERDSTPAGAFCWKERPKNLATVSEPSKENEFSGLTER